MYLVLALYFWPSYMSRYCSIVFLLNNYMFKPNHTPVGRNFRCIVVPVALYFWLNNYCTCFEPNHTPYARKLLFLVYSCIVWVPCVYIYFWKEACQHKFSIHFWMYFLWLNWVLREEIQLNQHYSMYFKAFFTTWPAWVKMVVTWSQFI
jgi:hypothetical protein